MRKIFTVIVISFLFAFGVELDVGGLDEVLDTLWSFDMKVLVPPFRFRAEGVLDDFQIEHECPGDREPTEAGFAVQSDYSLMSKPVFLTQSVRYEMVLPRTFNQEHIKILPVAPCSLCETRTEHHKETGKHHNSYSSASHSLLLSEKCFTY